MREIKRGILRFSSRTLNRAVAAAKRLGLAGELMATGGGSDGHVFNQMGIPSIVLGVKYRDVHSTNEHISIDDMVMNTRLALGIITGEKC